LLSEERILFEVSCENYIYFTIDTLAQQWYLRRLAQMADSKSIGNLAWIELIMSLQPRPSKQYAP
jgi:hypothetical protein